MLTRRIGSLEVSVIGLGGNDYSSGFDERRTAAVVDAAIDAGITFFDTAEDYGGGRSEEALGKALAGKRDRVVVATKYAAPPDVARDHLEASLRRLGTDYVDLYVLHRPIPGVPMAETLGALGSLADEGKIRELGCSNVDVAQIREAVAAAGDGQQGFANVQNEYNLFNRKAELSVLPECAASGLAFTAYFPIYHGFLTGAFRRNGPLPEGTRLAVASKKRQDAVFTDAHFDVLEALTRYANERGHSVVELALGRLLAEPGVAAVIPGASLPEHARANAAAGSWVLNDDDIAAVDRIIPCDPQSPDTPSTMNGYPI